MNIAKNSVGKTICKILSIVLAGVFMLSGSILWATAQDTEGEDFNIYLVQTTFDPAQYVPPAPAGLSMTDEQVSKAGLYLVQLNGPVLEEWKQALVDAGAQLGPYIPQYAFITKLDQVALTQVQALSFVRWVGAYEPAYKLSPDMDMTLRRSFRVQLAPWADAAKMNTLAASLDDQAQQYADGMVVVMNADQVNQMAFQQDVLWIEPFYINELYNNVGGGTIMNGAAAWANGYNGTSITIAVADTGLDTGNAASIHQDFMDGTTPRVAHISSWPVVAADYGGGCSVTNAGADDGASDTQSGHGTHVTGSVASDGSASSGTYKGLAYNSSITFQAIEQRATFTAACGVSGNAMYGLFGIPNDVRTLLLEAYNWGARVHNNSWGGGTAGVYDTQASNFDDFIFNHQDFAVVVAAGNAGVDGNSDGYVDNGSVNSPATAKNVITVGASENERASGTGGYTSYNWGTGSWLANFPANPTRDDRISSSRNHMAAFSSRGPTADTRLRPDVVAPGTDIISTRSSLASGTGWGTLNSYYMFDGGTSMASPLTAGAAAVVRQFLIAQGIANPSAALIKATLINTAVDISGYGNASYEAGAPIPNNSEGWGRVDVGAATTTGRIFLNSNPALTTGASFNQQYAIGAGGPLKVTLVWSDAAAAGGAGVKLVNNLNLRVTAPNGTTVYLGNVFSGGWSATGGSFDDRNNVENVYIQNPTAGLWRVEVLGTNVPTGPQAYALVITRTPAFRTNLPLVIRPLEAPGAFSKTTPVHGATGQSTSPTLTWGASAQAVSYEYCIDISNDSVCNGNGTIGTTTNWTSTGSTTNASRTGLTPGFTYYWQVRAINSIGTTLANGGTWWGFTPSATPVSPIVNGDFESGSSGWTEYSLLGQYPVITSNFSAVGITPHSGSYAAWLGGYYSEIRYVSQQVTIPADAPYLVYWHWIASADMCGWDYGLVIINNATVVDQYDLCDTTSTGGWVKHSVNLSAYTGQSVNIQIRAETDSSLNSNLFIDDVSLAAAPGAGPTDVTIPHDVDNSEATKTNKMGPSMPQPRNLQEKRLSVPR
jgi:subtilisin family serine protease